MLRCRLLRLLAVRFLVNAPEQFRIGWFQVAQPFQAVRTRWKACATRITDKTQSKTALRDRSPRDRPARGRPKRLDRPQLRITQHNREVDDVPATIHPPGVAVRRLARMRPRQRAPAEARQLGSLSLSPSKPSRSSIANQSAPLSFRPGRRRRAVVRRLREQYRLMARFPARPVRRQISSPRSRRDAAVPRCLPART